MTRYMYNKKSAGIIWLNQAENCSKIIRVLNNTVKQG